ncbi:prefoldin subunit 3 [Tetranychus urticae]|uniref:Prefoldin subunit 3 n=1 Tax=Tetranychus urticae TaxID=32264 RepID=T1JXU3_TETUR|nr:prefoldin subunit 3 [Tetranychus urticae]
MAEVTENTENSLGIPKAEFVEDVGKYMELQDKDATKLIRKLDEDHNKYRFMEMNLVQKKKKYKKQIPDIKETLNIISLMKLKKKNEEDMKTNFPVSDQVLMEALVKPTDRICLWLGANVMLEYPISEAEDLLSKNLQTALKNLEQLDKDLIFLRDQITTTEVNMARIYNWDVKRRQAEKNTAAAAVTAD